MNTLCWQMPYKDCTSPVGAWSLLALGSPSSNSWGCRSPLPAQPPVKSMGQEGTTSTHDIQSCLDTQQAPDLFRFCPCYPY